MKTKYGLSVFVAASIFIAGLSDCASSRVKPQQSYDKLRPIDIVPLTTSAPNLVIQLNHVADTPKHTPKNVKLFVNDKEILPEADTRLAEGNLIYQLQLADGVYKIKAVYRFKSFWKDKEHNITTKDGKVRIYPNQRTRLVIDLDRKPNGDLKKQKNYFTEMVEALSTPVVSPLLMPERTETSQVESRSESQIFPITLVNEESRRALPMPESGRRIEFPDPLKSITSPRPERRLPGEASPQSPVTSLPQPVSLDRAPQPIQPEPTPAPAQTAPAIDDRPSTPDRAGKIALQINTVPIHCDIIVDDKMVGQSPLTVYIDRFTNHVIQISHAGYEEKTKLLDYHVFGTETTYIFLEKLELKK